MVKRYSKNCACDGKNENCAYCFGTGVVQGKLSRGSGHNHMSAGKASSVCDKLGIVLPELPNEHRIETDSDQRRSDTQKMAGDDSKRNRGKKEKAISPRLLERYLDNEGLIRAKRVRASGAYRLECPFCLELIGAERGRIEQHYFDDHSVKGVPAFDGPKDNHLSDKRYNSVGRIHRGNEKENSHIPQTVPFTRKSRAAKNGEIDASVKVVSDRQLATKAETAVLRTISKDIECPNCFRPTPLLWLGKPGPTGVPLCKWCFYDRRGRKGTSTASYRAHYRPELQRVAADHWEVLEPVSCDFHELKSFLETCIEFQGPDDRDVVAITKDKRSLNHILDDLRSLARFSADGRSVDQKRYDIRLRIIERLGGMIAQESRAADRITIRRFPWRILPPGAHPFAQIMHHYQGLQKNNPDIEYDLDRLRKAHGLGPTSTYVGTDEFDGYIVFHFERQSVAVLECPIVGNAIYLLKGPWESLSMLSKSELLSDHARTVVRIVHRGNWYRQLRTALGRVSS